MLNCRSSMMSSRCAWREIMVAGGASRRMSSPASGSTAATIIPSVYPCCSRQRRVSRASRSSIIITATIRERGRSCGRWTRVPSRILGEPAPRGTGSNRSDEVLQQFARPAGQLPADPGEPEFELHRLSAGRDPGLPDRAVRRCPRSSPGCGGQWQLRLSGLTPEQFQAAKAQQDALGIRRWRFPASSSGAFAISVSRTRPAGAQRQYHAEEHYRFPSAEKRRGRSISRGRSHISIRPIPPAQSRTSVASTSLPKSSSCRAACPISGSATSRAIITSMPIRGSRNPIARSRSARLSARSRTRRQERRPVRTCRI